MHFVALQRSANNGFQRNPLTWNNFEFFGFKKQTLLKKLKLSPKFADFKQKYFQWVTVLKSEERFSRNSNSHNKQQVIFATSNKSLFAMSNFVTMGSE